MKKQENNESGKYPRIKGRNMNNNFKSYNASEMFTFGDWEKTTVGYVIWDEQGFYLGMDMSGTVAWMQKSTEGSLYLKVWTVDMTNAILVQANRENWKVLPYRIQKAVLFKGLQKVELLDSPIKVEDYLGTNKFPVRYVRTVNMPIYGCQVQVTIEVSDGSDPRGAAQWVVNAINFYQDSLSSIANGKDV